MLGSIGVRTVPSLAGASTYPNRMGGRDRWASPRLTSTAQSPNEPSGWAEIRHPFHPRRGQRFAVLKARCVAGVDTLILRDAERGSFAVAREWTDLAAPNSCERVDGSTGRLCRPCSFMASAICGSDRFTRAPFLVASKRLRTWAGPSIRVPSSVIGHNPA